MIADAPPPITPDEHADRRARLGERLGDSIALVYAGEHTDHLHGSFRPHPHFEYLTGLVDEPGAVLLLDPSHPVKSQREVLFLRPLNPELEQWDGLRDPIGSDLRTRLGIRTIHRTDRIPRHLGAVAGRCRSCTCLHPLAWIDQPVSPDLATFRTIAERVPGTEIHDGSGHVPEMRAAKSDAEVALIRHAGAITGAGFAAAMRALKPGANEWDVQEALHHAYHSNGSRGAGYGTIVGSGINSTVLHYRANDRTIEDGDLVCIDSGAGYLGYGADVTRTLPANGRFTSRQREIYDIVLAALDAAIASLEPGQTLAGFDAVARKVIKDAGYGDAFIHGTGHHLGLETHDASPPGPLQAGAVVTVEPGIYLPDEAIGVRIEDDIVVTEDGPMNLTSHIPRTADEVEAAMAAARA